ncbi:hypothetical protein GCM10010909_10680 [Acidocella aquatica]|uniref:Uncharacterized protein n=1 Tax=Acidocella aquatica TaxID=1922313 RepID=A0ABQ6A4X7_9PROT|nr:hypothetical protein GCM10010909_10680 [Acidocella aquatica]
MSDALLNGKILYSAFDPDLILFSHVIGRFRFNLTTGWFPK